MVARRRSRSWTALLAAHPLRAVLVLAVALRVVAVVVLGPFRDGVAVPDEAQYLSLAASVADGRGAEAWQPGYGGSLYDTTATFMRPLSALTWAFGPSQLSGQLLAATAGVLAAAITTLLALRLLRPGWAVLAGSTVAVLPSQVYWSSVVLRESMVWAALAALALVLAAASRASGVRLALLAGAGFVTLYLLSDLRGQTAVVAAWSLVVAALVVRHRHRVLVPVGAVVVAVLAPALAGLGPAGYGFVENAVPHLAVIRTSLSLGAESSIVETTPLAPRPGPSGSGEQGGPREAAPGATGAPGGPTTGPAPAVSPPPGSTVVRAPSGDAFVVEDTGAATSVSALPSGLVAVALRPFPWEPARNTGVRLAQLENAVWPVLYGLAAVGAVVGRRRWDVLAFPLTVAAAIMLSSAVTQGNLGTAFRHRGQLLWALALLAAVGLQHLADRRRARAT